MAELCKLSQHVFVKSTQGSQQGSSSPEPAAPSRGASVLAREFLMRWGSDASGTAPGPAWPAGKQHEEQTTRGDSPAFAPLAPVTASWIPHVPSSTPLSPRHGALSGLIDFFFLISSLLCVR